MGLVYDCVREPQRPVVRPTDGLLHPNRAAQITGAVHWLAPETREA